MVEPSTRAKWRALRSARSSTLKKGLTAPTLSETRCYANKLRSMKTLWQPLGLELSVGKRVENAGHLAGFVADEPLHPPVFPVEERVVLAGHKFRLLLAGPRLR